MSQSLFSGDSEPIGEFGGIVGSIMIQPEPTRLTRDMIRDGWEPFRAAVCGMCNSGVMWNPSRMPTALVCINMSCPCYGTTPEQNQALFKESLEITH